MKAPLVTSAGVDGCKGGWIAAGEAARIPEQPVCDQKNLDMAMWR